MTFCKDYFPLFLQSPGHYKGSYVGKGANAAFSRVPKRFCLVAWFVVPSQAGVRKQSGVASSFSAKAGLPAAVHKNFTNRTGFNSRT
jgi:hypothetical protein